MNKLLKDAIADAKAVRETALANAKAALEEAFAPKLQSMLSHKIAEEMDSDDEETKKMAKDEVAKMQELAGIYEEEEDDFGGETDEMGDAADVDDSEDVEDMGGEEDNTFSLDGEEYEVTPVGGEEGDDTELEELLRELDTEDQTSEYADPEDPTTMMEGEHEAEKEEVDEEIDLNELIQALREEDEEGDEGKDMESEEYKMEEAKMKKKSKMMETELNEAYDVIKFLRTKLNEVNLLNAKLLFVNKLFRKGNLTESQKVKIIETFDRAKNVRETKLIYSTLVESISNKVAPKTNKATKITEGLASAPQKKTKILTESNDIYNRFKNLVNYNNNY
jgi:hypothetical protein